MSHSLERLFSPGLFDIIFPFFAFALVIVVPFAFGIYVVAHIVRGRYSGEDQRGPDSPDMS